MNTIDDLRGEFTALAVDAPADDAVRAEFASRIARREKRRRTTALVAVAAAVVLVAGGIGVTSALLRSAPGTTQPASIPPVVDVPEVPLPADTQLIRHQLQPVTSPVTAVPPDGLTGMTWMQSPGRLVVSFFDRSTATGGVVVTSGGSSGPASAGYVITDAADEPVQTSGPDGAKAADVTRSSVTVGDRDATLETAPSDAVDAMGFPAAQRLSWQLPDGRYIHVWATGLPTRDSAPDTALVRFAESISDTAQTLPRAVGIGLTLPGLTVDSSMNFPVVGGFTPEYLLMCPPGVDPFTVTDSSSSGTGAALAPEAADAAESPSVQPAAPESSVATSDSPAESCLTVAVAKEAVANPGVSESATMVVAGTTVTVVSGSGHTGAMVDLGDGLTAVVAAPPSTTLSNDDLAALAASVRLSPDVEVLPPGSPGSGGAAVGSASSSAVVSSSATAIPSGASDPNPDSYSGNPIDVDRVDSVTATLGPDRTIAMVEFTLRNMAAKPVDLQSLGLTIPGLEQIGLKVRLDNTPADADTAFQEAVLPTMFAPGTRVRIQVQARVDQCSAVTDDPPQLKVEWQAESSGGGFTQDLPITDPPGGLKELLAPFCG